MDRDVETRPTGLNNESLRRAAYRELQTLLGIVIIAAIVYWMFRARKRNLPVFACLLLAAISYLPVSDIVPLNASVAEHWIYLPTAFLFLAVAIQFQAFLQSRGAATRFIAGAILVIWLLFLGMRTFIRTFDWKDQRTFLEQTIASGGDSARMLINLGSLDLNEGKLDDAAVQLHAALQKKPDQPFALLDLATVAFKQNDFQLARSLIDRARNMPPIAAKAQELLAVLESREKGHIEVLRFRLAAHTGAADWSIQKRYIQALDQTGATGAAINELLGCLQTQWYRAESWQLLSQLEARAGHPDQAASALDRARAYDVHLNAH